MSAYQLLCGHKFQTQISVPINLGKYQRVQWLDHMPRMYLVLLKTIKLSKVDMQLCIPINNAWEFLLLHILVSIWYGEDRIGDNFIQLQKNMEIK